MQCWDEYLLDIEAKQLAVDWTIDDPWRIDPIVPQEGRRRGSLDDSFSESQP
jgi:hypothetical protein